VQQQAYKPSSLSECTTLPELSRTLLNPLINPLIRCHIFSSEQCRCCDRKDRAACAQSFALWQQATIEFTCHDHSIIACSRHIYIIVLRTHPVRGESHIQRNATGEVAIKTF